MSFKLKNQKELINYIAGRAKVIEQSLIYYLEYAVSELTEHAITNKGYQDQTANLKSSIGGCVLKDGKPVTYRGFEGQTAGKQTGLEFLNSLISSVGSGYTIIIVAGMEYATYVENYHGLNVLKKTELAAPAVLKSMIDELKGKFK
jgi:hypothetical protein